MNPLEIGCRCQHHRERIRTEPRNNLHYSRIRLIGVHRPWRPAQQPGQGWKGRPGLRAENSESLRDSILSRLRRSTRSIVRKNESNQRNSRKLKPKTAYRWRRLRQPLKQIWDSLRADRLNGLNRRFRGAVIERVRMTHEFCGPRTEGPTLISGFTVAPRPERQSNAARMGARAAIRIQDFLFIVRRVGRVRRGYRSLRRSSMVRRTERSPSHANDVISLSAYALASEACPISFRKIWRYATSTRAHRQRSYNGR